jgi:hypothetical protein
MKNFMKKIIGIIAVIAPTAAAGKAKSQAGVLKQKF